jgi:hypothetical protein
MIVQCDFQASFSFFSAKPIVVQPSDEQMSSDGGLLIFRELDEQLGWTQQFAEVLTDPREEAYVQHSFEEMVRMRIYGVLAGYADQNDHDLLRSDPVFKLIAGRSLDDPDLASQPTLSRFENAIDVPSLFRLEELFLEQFIESFDEPPLHITLDIDTFDDPTHGDQQLTFFHGFYNQYQYLTRLITCAETDQVVAIQLLHGCAHAADSAEDDLSRVIRRLREAFPDVRIDVRGDSAFGAPRMYEMCESEDVYYSLGIGMNAAFQNSTEALLTEAIADFEATGEDQRRFCAFWHRADTWRVQRWVIVKVEVNHQGTNRRAIVTNRPGGFFFFEAAYDGYADRGESENRNKEFKLGLEADRLSDHRYMANLFRLHLHGLAYNLLIRLRRTIAAPALESLEGNLRSEALAGDERKAHQNRRRREDPLGEGQPCTWRMRLIKVACRVKETVRRVVVHLSGCWPFLPHYRDVSEQLLGGQPGEASLG